MEISSVSPGLSKKFEGLYPLKFNIEISFASKTAVDKIKKAGGTITLTKN